MSTDQRRGYARCPCLASPPSTRSSALARSRGPSRTRSGTRWGRELSSRSRFGNARRRGVVVDADAEAPPDVEPVAAERVLETLPPALVDLALWLADYYGSTPARALALIAPQQPKRRGERREVAATSALAAEPAPARLSESQERALARIESLLAGGGGNVLLAGATGSGKTEVYIRACEAAVATGRGAIVLVPEIALTPQTLGRFRARFGDRVALLHSGLSEAERRDERERIVAGEASVVVGARSAVFAPLPSLGVICVDEEHDASYKQESDPRYDARTVAAKRATLEGAVAIFGSATPRPESWQALERLELGGRIGAPMPTVRVVDLRHETGYPLSAPLLAELGRLAEGGGKAILLLNRRGVAPALHCRACGSTLRCANCDVAFTLHADGTLRCHHCGAREPASETCPACGSPELARIGAGTQRLERELEKHVPELERIRLDADAVAKPEQLRGGARAVRAGRARRPRRDADGRQGAPFRGRRAGRGRRRRHRARPARLSCRGADVPAPHPARGPQRPRGAGARHRADVPARVARGGACRAPRRRRLPRRRARAPPCARLSAVPAPRPRARLRTGGSPTRSARSRS